MNNFVTLSDFINDRNIPLNSEYTADFTSFITKYQKEILIKLLGYDLYLAFETGMAEEEPEDKWTDLKNGSTYQVNGINYQNPGVIDIIAYYVYCKHLSVNYEQYTTIGVTANKAENGVTVSPENKITNAWNNMLHYYYMVYDFLANNQTDYPNWEFTELKLITYGF